MYFACASTPCYLPLSRPSRSLLAPLGSPSRITCIPAARTLPRPQIEAPEKKRCVASPRSSPFLPPSPSRPLFPCYSFSLAHSRLKEKRKRRRRRMRRAGGEMCEGRSPGGTTRQSWYKEERGRGKRRRWKRLKAKAPCWWRWQESRCATVAGPRVQRQRRLVERLDWTITDYARCLLKSCTDRARRTFFVTCRRRDAECLTKGRSHPPRISERNFTVVSDVKFNCFQILLQIFVTHPKRKKSKISFLQRSNIIVYEGWHLPNFLLVLCQSILLWQKLNDGLHFDVEDVIDNLPRFRNLIFLSQPRGYCWFRTTVFSKQPDADCSSGCVALDSLAHGGRTTPAVLRLMKLSGPGPPATTSTSYDSQLSHDYAIRSYALRHDDCAHFFEGWGTYKEQPRKLLHLVSHQSMKRIILCEGTCNLVGPHTQINRNIERN